MIDTASMRLSLETLEEDLHKLRATSERLRKECLREIERTSFTQDDPVDAAHSLALLSARLEDAAMRAAASRRALSDYDDVLVNEENP